MKILLIEDRSWTNSLTELVRAHAAATDTLKADELCVHAASSHIEVVSGELPKHIQWMPPGKQIVQPMGFDEPFEMTVTPMIAAAADRQLQLLRAKAAAGNDAEPYGDFNHKDEERAYKALRFWWGGDDLKTGGVRLDLGWTGGGAKAVRDGTLPYNSPSWILNKVSKAFIGITHNVGGLVPRSAFHSIQAFAKAETISDRNGGSGSHQHEPKTKNTMTPEQEKQLADLGAAVTGLTKTVSDISIAMAKAAKDGEKITSIEGELKTIKDGQVAQAKSSALVLVTEHGIHQGRIAAQDNDTINFWVDNIVGNAKALDQLKKLPVNPALKTIVANAKDGKTTTTTTDEHEFVVKAKAYGEKNKITDEIEAQAKFAGTTEGKELYQAYRDSLGAQD